MKIQTSLFAIFTLIPVFANAYSTYTASERYSYGVAIQNANMNQDTNMEVHDSNPYVNYNGCTGRACECAKNNSEDNNFSSKKTAKSNTTDSIKILNPFFERKGFYSITEYEHLGYKFDLKNVTSSYYGDTMRWDSKADNITEEIGFGFSDKFSIFGALTYHKDKAKFKDLTYDNSTDSGTYLIGRDYLEYKDDGINNYWFGLSYKPYEDDDFVTRLIGGFAKQEDSDYFYISGLAGYKYAKQSVFYLKGIVYAVNYDESGPKGVGALTDDESAGYGVFWEDTDSSTLYELSIGTFADLGAGFTLDLRGTYADYSWHKDIIGRAELGFQFNDYVAIYGFGKYTFSNDAEGNYYSLGEYDYTTGWSDFGGSIATSASKLEDIKDISFGAGLKIHF